MTGYCGEELWIADELWRQALKLPRDYDAFVRLVVAVLSAQSVTPRRGRPPNARLV